MRCNWKAKTGSYFMHCPMRFLRGVLLSFVTQMFGTRAGSALSKLEALAR